MQTKSQFKHQQDDIKKNTIADSFNFPEKKVNEIIKSLEKEFGKFPISNVNSTLESESYHIEIGGGDYILYQCSSDLVTLHWFNSIKQVSTQIESVTYTQLTNILRLLCDRNLTKLGEVKDVKEVNIFDRIIQRFGIPDRQERHLCMFLIIEEFNPICRLFYNDVHLDIYEKDGIRPESIKYTTFVVHTNEERDIRVNYFQDLDKYLKPIIK
jgi:hypothetical protein